MTRKALILDLFSSVFNDDGGDMADLRLMYYVLVGLAAALSRSLSKVLSLPLSSTCSLYCVPVQFQ